jgi:hypothetical protein
MVDRSIIVQRYQEIGDLCLGTGELYEERGRKREWESGRNEIRLLSGLWIHFRFNISEII